MRTYRYTYEQISASLSIREMQMKTIMRYPVTPVRTVIFKKPQATTAGKSVVKRQPCYTLGCNVNWYSQYGEQYGGS